MTGNLAIKSGITIHELSNDSKNMTLRLTNKGFDETETVSLKEFEDFWDFVKRY